MRCIIGNWGYSINWEILAFARRSSEFESPYLHQKLRLIDENFPNTPWSYYISYSFYIRLYIFNIE